MADKELLSEGEMEALMESVDERPAEAASDGRYRTFDFSSREQALLAQFAALPSLTERHAELLGAALGAFFDQAFSLEAVSPTLLSYQDLLMQQEAMAGFATVSLAPLAGRCHVISNPDLLSYLVNQYYGGGRTAPPAVRSRAQLSGSELRMAERLAELVLETQREAWADRLTLAPGEIEMAMHPDALAAEPGSELALCFSFSVHLADGSSPLRLILPFAGLEPHKLRFAPPRRRDGGSEAPTWEPHLRRELLTVPVELSAVLASRDMSLAELLALGVGSVIAMPAPGSARLQVEGEPFAEGQYGAHGGHKAVKLTTLARRLTGAAGKGE